MRKFKSGTAGWVSASRMSFLSCEIDVSSVLKKKASVLNTCAREEWHEHREGGRRWGDYAQKDQQTSAKISSTISNRFWPMAVISAIAVALTLAMTNITQKKSTFSAEF